MRLNMGFMARVFAQGQTTFQPPPDPITVIETILPMTAYDLQHYEGGAYTTEDVKVIVPGRVALPLQTRFEHGGATFEIREERDYEAVADLRRYVAKRLRDPGGDAP